MNKFLSIHLNKLKKKYLNPELDLRILLNKSAKTNKEIILSNFNINDINIKKFESYFQRRIKDEPISKIFNLKNFWKYDFIVNKQVLDPRPETELIIEKVLEYFPNKNKKLRILDICTGSGCIAICLAKEYINSKIDATDISPKAINIARKNSKKLNCSNQIKFIVCDLIKEINKYDIVISNPPYLSKSDYREASLEIKKNEPKEALLALDNGYEFYIRFCKILPKLLDNHSIAFIEIGSTQANKTMDIFKLNNIETLKLVKDIQNLDRLLILNKTC